MLKTAFIGTGGISGVHLNYLKKRKDVRIAALCDVNATWLEKRQKEFGGETFTDYQRMLDAVKPDAVWLCTPPIVREGPLVACAERGIPVFCEKPVERDPKRGVRIAAKLARLKARVQVGYCFRATPSVLKLREAMADDRVHLIQSFYGCDVSLTMGLPKWFYDKSKSGGMLIDQATHNLDLLRYFFGEVREVRGSAENPVHRKKPGYTVEETLALALHFEKGVVGSHIHTWVGDGWRNEMFFVGEKRLYRLNLGRGRLVIEGPDAHLKSAAKRLHLRKNAHGHLCFEQDQSRFYHYENDVFLQQVRSGKWRENPSDYADGLKTLQLTYTCDRAIS
jgi:predicted dehydrogenase